MAWNLYKPFQEIAMRAGVGDITGLAGKISKEQTEPGAAAPGF